MPTVEQFVTEGTYLTEVTVNPNRKGYANESEQRANYNFRARDTRSIEGAIDALITTPMFVEGRNVPIVITRNTGTRAPTPYSVAVRSKNKQPSITPSKLVTAWKEDTIHIT